MTDLSENQIKALPIFATQLNIEKACEEAGIGRNTFYEWRKQPAFKNELTRLRHEIGCQAIDLMKVASRKAAATLIQLLGESYPPGVRRAAANDILNYVRGTQEDDKGSIRSFDMGMPDFF